MSSRSVLICLVAFFSLGDLRAQQQLSSARTSSTAAPTTGTGTSHYAHESGLPRVIQFDEGTTTASSFLDNINEYLNLPAEFTFAEVESTTDELGMQHRLFEQYYKGIPIEGMGYRIHEKDGYITSANGKGIRDIRVDTQTILSEEDAFHLAVNYVNSRDTTLREGKKLIVSRGFTNAPASFSVAYQFDIDVSLIERWRISIDARTGDLLNKISLVNTCIDGDEPPLPYGTGTGTTNYYGTQTIQVERYESGSSRLVGQTEHGVIIGTYDYKNVSIMALLFGLYDKFYDFYSSNNVYNSPYQRPAVSVQWAAEQASNYYYKKHNRWSFDNKGTPIKSYVHVDVNLNNAFWTGKMLAFGDGNNNNPLVELDVVSHELTHGVIQYEAKLLYSNEPGALNESFADIFGKAVEFHTFGDSATWQLARYNRSGGIRDMSNPNIKSQPDTYRGDMWYTGYEDNGGVHVNSGVQNFWFYLLCEGGSGENDQGVSYSVNPIGIEAATKIAYRNLTDYLINSSDYLDSRIGSLLATADLYGKNSTVYQEVEKAWDAVGVIDEPIITGLELYDITATTVKFKGSLLPRGDTVTYHIEYGTTPDFGSSSSVYEYTDKVEGMLTGLQSETKHYLRLVATNENGDSYYPTEFTTISLAPLVKIRQTVDVTETTARLHGKINPNSLPTSFRFEYGTTPELGLSTPAYALKDTTEFMDVSLPVIDLQPRQTYYYRLVATNDFATSTTESAHFFTATKPVIASHEPVAAPVGTEIVITGKNFNTDREKNLVTFGATRGTVLSANETTIKVKVPPGASLGPISVLDAESGLAGESVQDFVPTFNSEVESGSLQLAVGSTDPAWQTLVHDMDGDGKPDIVLRHNLGFSIYQNVNTGGDISDESFVRRTFNSENSPGLFSLVDFDGNGLKDIVIEYVGALRIYPNNSVPGFVFFGVPVDITHGYFRDITFDDFDQDGHVDIAGIRYLPEDSCEVVILRNQNPAGFMSAENFQEQDTTALPFSGAYLYSDDLDHDGKPELVAEAFDMTLVPVLKNNSRPGTFDFEPYYAPDSNPERLSQYLFQDLNQDGYREIISHASSEVANVSVFQNQSSSSNIAMANPVAVLTGYEESTVKPTDINGDGKVDLMVGFSDSRFVILKNKADAGQQLSASSFEKSSEHGVSNSSATRISSVSINDLNGDGRPEIINTIAYNRYLHGGYTMQIWLNSPRKCPDPSLITLRVSNYSAQVLLPDSTSLDQFEIDYAPSYSSSWMRASSTTLSYLQSGQTYKLRARAKCYLGFTEYYYVNFTTDCVDINSFYVSNIQINSANINATNLSSFEVQYSMAGTSQWTTHAQNARQILNLLPGTTYEVRFRGRCYTSNEFSYTKFTTLCPNLSTLSIGTVESDWAVANWTSNYTGRAVLEYSTDRVNWMEASNSGIMSPLTPATQYFVRGKLACTNINSDFIYTSFTTRCPYVSTLQVDPATPFSARITWEDTFGADSYTVHYSMTGGVVSIKKTNSTSVDIDALMPGTEYTVSVAPQCSGESVWSSIVFTTECYVPTDLSVSSTTHTSAQLSWNDNFGGHPYYVDYTISGDNAWRTVETASTQMALSDLRPGTEYEARVHINCLSTTAPFVSVLFQTQLYDETTLAPNPTDDRVTIHPSTSLIGRRFRILDGAGRILHDSKLVDYTIDLSLFAPGIYTFLIDDETPMRVMKR